MPFPETPRVIYGKNPLEEVVCQLRFPPILRIDAEPPAAFQDQVRDTFPLYQRTSSSSRLMAANQLPLKLPNELLNALAGANGVIHEFASSDQVWKLSLTRDFLALTTSGYTEWSGFKTKFLQALEGLAAQYRPAFFNRVGLRYRDRIDRNRFGLKGVPWRDLLRDEAVGELGDPNLGAHVEHILKEMIVALGHDGGRVRVVHGLQIENSEQTYIIDADFYTNNEQSNSRAVVDVLDAFNRRAGHLFRWYVKECLHAAMEPRDAQPR